MLAAFMLSMVSTTYVTAQGVIETPKQRKEREAREAEARRKKQQQEAAAKKKRQEEEARLKREAEEQAAREKAAREQEAREKAEREKAEREMAEALREQAAKEAAEKEKEEKMRVINRYVGWGTMAEVSGGTFEMGATKEQGSDASNDEKPVHSVTVKPFKMTKYEVTQEFWEVVMGDNPSKVKGAKLPVTNVSWKDCKSFIKKLNLLTGGEYRLPTEAEWEFAARGGKMSRGYRYAGDNELDAVAWYDSNSRGQIHEVGTKAPNELGLYDMAGNVFEWCEDWYTKYSSNAQTDPLIKEPTDNEGFEGFYVARGGSMNSKNSECRVAYRRSTTPYKEYDFVGFRLVTKGYEEDTDAALTAKYMRDGIPFMYGNAKPSDYSDMDEEYGAMYEEEMIEIVGLCLKDQDLPKKLIYDLIEENGIFIVYLIVTSDHTQSEKEAWLRQCQNYEDSDPEIAELGIKLYKEIYNDLKKKNK